MEQGKAEVTQVQGLHTTLTPARGAQRDQAPQNLLSGQELQDRAANPG